MSPDVNMIHGISRSYLSFPALRSTERDGSACQPGCCISTGIRWSPICCACLGPKGPNHRLSMGFRWFQPQVNPNLLPSCSYGNGAPGPGDDRPWPSFSEPGNLQNQGMTAWDSMSWKVWKHCFCWHLHPMKSDDFSMIHSKWSRIYREHHSVTNPSL